MKTTCLSYCSVNLLGKTELIRGPKLHLYFGLEGRSLKMLIRNRFNSEFFKVISDGTARRELKELTYILSVSSKIFWRN